MRLLPLIALFCLAATPPLPPGVSNAVYRAKSSKVIHTPKGKEAVKPLLPLTVAAPKAVVGVRSRPVVTNYWAVTDTSTNGLTSLLSAEVARTNSLVSTNGGPWLLLNKPGAQNLVWSPVPAATNYEVYQGTASRTYTASNSAGTNLSFPIPLPNPTNLVITVTGSTNFSLTNPPLPMMLFTGQNLTITRRYQ